MKRSERNGLPVRRARLGEERADADWEFWRTKAPVERMIACWQMSAEVYGFAGHPVAERGLRGSPARVVRR